jgi:hypothetical protein
MLLTHSQLERLAGQAIEVMRLVDDEDFHLPDAVRALPDYDTLPPEERLALLTQAERQWRESVCANSSAGPRAAG